MRFRSAGFTHATANADTSHFLSVIVAFARSQGRPDSTRNARPSGCSLPAPSACAQSTTLFCLKDACVLDVTVPPGAAWAGPATVLVIPVTGSAWSTRGSPVATPSETLVAGMAVYEAAAGVQWRNGSALPARLIAFSWRP